MGRIAEHTEPGRVLASQDFVDAVDETHPHPEVEDPDESRNHLKQGGRIRCTTFVP
jgi:hypothetical protein